MNKLVPFTNMSPALYATTSFSCKVLSFTAQRCRCLSTSVSILSADNKNIKVNPLFTNRNPRALEFMGLEPKRKGWKYQAPRKDYYHKLVYDKEHARAHVEHCSGKIVLEASSSEPAVAKHLYSLTDVSANRNVGLLLARRMLEAGITSVFYDETDTDLSSKKKQAFLAALKENAIELKEPEEVQHEHVPGINYDGYNRLGEDRMYQQDYQKLEKDEMPVTDGLEMVRKVTARNQNLEKNKRIKPIKSDKTYRT